MRQMRQILCQSEENVSLNMRETSRVMWETAFYRGPAPVPAEAADLRTAGETQVTWDWAFPPNSWENTPPQDS